MIYQLGGCKPLAAKGAVINRAIRITGNLGHFAFLGIGQNPATAVAHAAMAFDNPIKAVSLHLFFNIRMSKVGHVLLQNLAASFFKNSPSVKSFSRSRKTSKLKLSLQVFLGPILILFFRKSLPK
jgi:hypothetical protein